MVEQCHVAMQQLLAYTHHKEINVNKLINNLMFNLIHSTIMELDPTVRALVETQFQPSINPLIQALNLQLQQQLTSQGISSHSISKAVDEIRLRRRQNTQVKRSFWEQGTMTMQAPCYSYINVKNRL